MYWKAITAGAWTTATNWATSSGTVATWGTASTYPGSSSATYTPDDDVYLNGLNMTSAVIGLQLNLKSFNSTALSIPGFISSSVGGNFSISANTTITASNGFTLGNTSNNFISFASSGITLTLSGSKFDCTNQSSAGAGIALGGISTTSCTINLIADNITTPTANGTTINYPANANTQTLNIRGNVTSTTSNFLLINNTNNTVTITGSLLANGSANLFNGGITTFNISGNLTSTSTGYVVNNSSTNPVTIIGNVTAGTGTPAFLSTSTALVTINGSIINNGPVMGVVAQRLLFNPTSPNGISIQNTDGVTNTWQAQGAVSYTGLPSATDVRFTVTFGPSSTSGQVVIPSANDVRFGVLVNTGSATGLMIVPSASDVRFGTLVNTGSATGSMYVPLTSQVKQGVSVNTGSATGSYAGPADIWSYATASLTTGVGKLIKDNLDVNVGSVSSSIMSELNKSGSSYAVVTRLQNAATVGTTGDQISSFNT